MWEGFQHTDTSFTSLIFLVEAFSVIFQLKYKCYSLCLLN